MPAWTSVSMNTFEVVKTILVGPGSLGGTDVEVEKETRD